LHVLLILICSGVQSYILYFRLQIFSLENFQEKISPKVFLFGKHFMSLPSKDGEVFRFAQEKPPSRQKKKIFFGFVLAKS